MTRPSAHIVIGLGYGDEGKGLMVDYLCRRHQARLVIRFSGGPQPTHTVQLKDGKRHSFAQFGAGTFIPDCYTYLSDYMCIEPYALLNEYQALYALGIDDALKRLYIDPFCTVITPYHWLANRLRESARAENRHGSCGMGLHECKKDRNMVIKYMQTVSVMLAMHLQKLKVENYLSYTYCLKQILAVQNTMKKYERKIHQRLPIFMPKLPQNLN